MYSAHGFNIGAGCFRDENKEKRPSYVVNAGGTGVNWVDYKVYNK